MVQNPCKDRCRMENIRLEWGEICQARSRLGMGEAVVPIAPLREKSDLDVVSGMRHII